SGRHAPYGEGSPSGCPPHTAENPTQWGPDDADAPGMRTGGRSTLQMSWLATALAGLLGIATPAVAHLAAERADTPPATAQIALSGAGVPVALLHDQPYPPRTVTRRDPPAHRRPATKATLRVAKAARPAPGAPAVPSEPQLLVRVPAGGSAAHRRPWASAPRGPAGGTASGGWHARV